jgi:hypothetical protein
MVMVWYELVVPTGAEKLTIEAGVTVTGAFPEPVSVNVCGLNRASSATLSVAVLVPVPVGAKVTNSEQCAVARTDAGTVGQELVTPKSLLLVPPIVTEEMFRGTFCSLVSVTVLTALVVPSYWVPNDSEVGESSTGGIPVPVRAAVSGVLGALVLTVSEVAGTAPRAVGDRVSRMVQLELAASVLTHVPPVIT